jgi:RNA polymerase sigma factor (sigma-70 family)
MSTATLTPPAGQDDPGRVFDRYLNVVIRKRLRACGLSNVLRPAVIFARVRGSFPTARAEEVGRVILGKGKGIYAPACSMLGLAVESEIDRLACDRGFLVIGRKPRHGCTTGQLQNPDSLPSRLDDHVEDISTQDWYQDALGELTGEQLMALEKHIEGFSTEEIAEIIGVSRSTAYDRVAKAKKTLKAKLTGRRGF